MANKNGKEAFLNYYSTLYGESWPALEQALTAPTIKTKLQSPWPEVELTYELDPASQMVAHALAMEPRQRFLDLCSAPGGKALSCIYQTRGEGEYVLNDLSSARVARLKRVIRQHCPAHVVGGVQVFNRDGAKWGLYQPNHFDRILVDAPCSGERHLLESKSDLEAWTLKRSKGLAARQYALLCSALMALKPGGLMVYSTCSLSPVENDAVIDRLIERKGDNVQLLQPKQHKVGQPTKRGHLIRPDQDNGWGPMYFSVLKKI